MAQERERWEATGVGAAGSRWATCGCLRIDDTEHVRITVKAVHLSDSVVLICGNWGGTCDGKDQYCAVAA